MQWDTLQRLGDERGVGLRAGAFEHEAVVRAYRQLAAQLRAEGMSEVADRFARRAQIRQRSVLLRRGKFGQYLFSGFLALLAGYGYRPGRTLFWYLAVISGFAIAYFRVTHGLPVLFLAPSPLKDKVEWTQAFVLSFSAFHGRGIFNPPGDLAHPVAILATAESVFGLFIEISFIATFTQRFFGAK